MRPGITLLKPLARPSRTHGRRRPLSSPVPMPPAPSAIIDCGAYVHGRRVHATDVKNAYARVRAAASEGERPFVWVGLHEPEAAELDEIAEIFGLHPLAVEDAVHAHQRPKLERYDDIQFVVIKTVTYQEGGSGAGASEVVDSGEIMVFLGPDFVVTVRHGDHCELQPVRRELEGKSELLELGPSAVLYAVADRAVDGYMAVANALQEELDEVEARVFSTQRSNEVERIYQLKRELIDLKRAVVPLAQPMRQVTARRKFPAEMRDYFRDVEDHLTRVREQVESCDELLTSILQAHMTQVTVAENQDMRRISAWVAIFAVPTMIAGIYGMNFDHMPELHSTYGYPMVLAIMAGACTLMYRGFRRNGWL
ncbi:MAG: magnesium/cobalt transporter CorA [Streptosporangiales bacterium]|nr:magnesium/cobalt transporter CorA [Streptosporangiales bacterium]